MIDRITRLRRDALPALRAARELESHDAWDHARLEAHARERLLAIVRHAAQASPYYREAFAGIALDDDLDPRALPTLDKQTVLDNWDAIVTDPRLRLTDVQRGLEGAADDELHLDSYRTMASGGTTGRRGVFVYGVEDWHEALGGMLRWTGDLMGLRPRLPRRRKVASIVAASPQHMTARMARSTDVGIHRFLRLDARRPIAELVDALNLFRPEAVVAYASVAAMLADEQIAGRLQIVPRAVCGTSEVLTADMAARIGSAWGSTPFDCYGTTETGMLACDCDRHAGLHVFEDLVHVEVVDDDGRPVADGLPGSRILVTNLINRTQPLIRYELTDLVTISPEPCPCGRPYKLIEKIDGRTDDVLSLAAPAGGEVTVHPLVLRSPLAKVAGLRQYRIVHDDEGLHVEAVLMDGCGEQTRAEVGSRLRAALGEAGAGATAVEVVQVEAIERHAGSGKAKLIESRRGSAASTAR